MPAGFVRIASLVEARRGEVRRPDLVLVEPLNWGWPQPAVPNSRSAACLGRSEYAEIALQ